VPDLAANQRSGEGGTMRMIPCFIKMIFGVLFVFSQIAQADNPLIRNLNVNDTWKYVFESDKGLLNLQELRELRFQVVSKEESADSKTYHLRIVDTLMSRIVFTGGQGIFPYSAVIARYDTLFYKAFSDCAYSEPFVY
jgi:hypothetical protein